MLSVHTKEYINVNQVPGGIVLTLNPKWFLLVEPGDSCYVDLLLDALNRDGMELLKMLDQHQQMEGLPLITKATIQLWQDKQKGRK